jgi:cation transport ATPase
LCGVLVRDAQSLEKLAKVDTLLIDKTGTLTEGRPELVEVYVVGTKKSDANKRSRKRAKADDNKDDDDDDDDADALIVGTSEQREALTALASLEQGSEHALGAAIMRGAARVGITVESVDKFEALPGKVCWINLCCGNFKLIVFFSSHRRECEALSIRSMWRSAIARCWRRSVSNSIANSSER